MPKLYIWWLSIGKNVNVHFLADGSSPKITLVILPALYAIWYNASFLLFSDRQLWKFIDTENKLTNKKYKCQTLNLIADRSSLDEAWNFKTEVIWDKTKNMLPNFGGFFCSQRWKKGKENEEGYFTLRALESSKLLTAFQEGLELKGNEDFYFFSHRTVVRFTSFRSGNLLTL